MSKSLMVAHLSWATWANRSQSLICFERSEQIAHSHSFDLSEMSKWANSQPCTILFYMYTGQNFYSSLPKNYLTIISTYYDESVQTEIVHGTVHWVQYICTKNAFLNIWIVIQNCLTIQTNGWAFLVLNLWPFIQQWKTIQTNWKADK